MQTPTVYPCPCWCQVSDWLPGHREDEWSEDDTHAVRPHSTAVFGKREMALPVAQGTQGYTVDIGADEVAPMLAQGRRGPSLFEEPLIGLYAWVLGESGVDVRAVLT